MAAVFLLAAAAFFSCPGEACPEGYPQRIVSLGPLNTENVFLLGAGSRLVADTAYCVRPAAAREIEKIGTLMEINIEKIVALRPDIVLATGLTQPGDISKLRHLGLRVERFERPDSFASLCKQLLRLGEILGCGARARAIIKDVRRKVQCIRNVVSTFPVRTVFFQVGANPLFASVKGSFTEDYIRFAGGENIIGDQSTGLTALEKVLARDPEVIIIAIMGSETGVAAREKKRWMHFRSMRAAQNGRVYTISPDLVCSPSPVTFVHALATMAGMIHPEAADLLAARCAVSEPMF